MHKETITRQRLKELVREVMVEEADYQEFFKKALEKAGKSIAQMSDDEKKSFFNKVDSAWNSKGEKK
jgi:adenylosuccinate lyase